MLLGVERVVVYEGVYRGRGSVCLRRVGRTGYYSKSLTSFAIRAKEEEGEQVGGLRGVA
jgi:hypothetical protein